MPGPYSEEQLAKDRKNRTPHETDYTVSDITKIFSGFFDEKDDLKEEGRDDREFSTLYYYFRGETGDNEYMTEAGVLASAGSTAKAERDMSDALEKKLRHYNEVKRMAGEYYRNIYDNITNKSTDLSKRLAAVRLAGEYADVMIHNCQVQQQMISDIRPLRNAVNAAAGYPADKPLTDDLKNDIISAFESCSQLLKEYPQGHEALSHVIGICSREPAKSVIAANEKAKKDMEDLARRSKPVAAFYSANPLPVTLKDVEIDLRMGKVFDFDEFNGLEEQIRAAEEIRRSAAKGQDLSGAYGAAADAYRNIGKTADFCKMVMEIGAYNTHLSVQQQFLYKGQLEAIIKARAYAASMEKNCRHMKQKVDDLKEIGRLVARCKERTAFLTRYNNSLRTNVNISVGKEEIDRQMANKYSKMVTDSLPRTISDIGNSFGVFKRMADSYSADDEIFTAVNEYLGSDTAKNAINNYLKQVVIYSRLQKEAAKAPKERKAVASVIEPMKEADGVEISNGIFSEKPFEGLADAVSSLGVRPRSVSRGQTRARTEDQIKTMFTKEIGEADNLELFDRLKNEVSLINEEGSSSPEFKEMMRLFNTLQDRSVEAGDEQLADIHTEMIAAANAYIAHKDGKMVNGRWVNLSKTEGHRVDFAIHLAEYSQSVIDYADGIDKVELKVSEFSKRDVTESFAYVRQGSSSDAFKLMAAKFDAVMNADSETPDRNAYRQLKEAAAAYVRYKTEQKPETERTPKEEARIHAAKAIVNYAGAMENNIRYYEKTESAVQQTVDFLTDLQTKLQTVEQEQVKIKKGKVTSPASAEAVLNTDSIEKGLEKISASIGSFKGYPVQDKTVAYAYGIAADGVNRWVKAAEDYLNAYNAGAPGAQADSPRLEAPAHAETDEYYSKLAQTEVTVNGKTVKPFEKIAKMMEDLRKAVGFSDPGLKAEEKRAADKASQKAFEYAEKLNVMKDSAGSLLGTLEDNVNEAAVRGRNSRIKDYALLAAKFPKIDKSLRSSDQFKEMARQFKKLGTANLLPEGERKDIFGKAARAAAAYLVYKDPGVNGKDNVLSEYEQARVGFARQLLNYCCDSRVVKAMIDGREYLPYESKFKGLSEEEKKMTGPELSAESEKLIKTEAEKVRQNEAKERKNSHGRDAASELDDDEEWLDVEDDELEMGSDIVPF